MESSTFDPNKPELDDVLDNDAHEDAPFMATSLQDKDNPDPFAIVDTFHPDDMDLLSILVHLLMIYAVISWLHFQFHLPCVACNTLLTILGFLLVSILPSLLTPFVTLQSSNCTLGLNKPNLLLPVCPACLEVYPLAGFIHS